MKKKLKKMVEVLKYDEELRKEGIITLLLIAASALALWWFVF